MTGTREFLGGKVVMHCGDCLQVLDTLVENSADSVVCDPPYHLASIVKRFGAGKSPPKHGTDGAFTRAATGFMGKQWDGGDIAFQPETWAKVLRVMKPGAYILAFSSSRTFGRMSVAIEDAGFITHPMIGWLFAQGFPKAHRVDVLGREGWRYGAQALKPALEPIYMGQKPFSEKTGSANVARWGSGAINIEGCRIDAVDQDKLSRNWDPDSVTDLRGGRYIGGEPSGIALSTSAPSGRWPANLMHDGSPEVVAMFPESDQSNTSPRLRQTGDVYGAHKDSTYEPIRDSGSAARFFWSSKAAADDRLGSKHPTVKPIDLIQELVRLITPPGGTVLDCFAGTGTAAEAAFREGFRAILIEREAEYQADIARRMGLILAGPDERSHATIRARGKVADAGPLFGDSSENKGGGYRTVYGKFAQDGQSDQSE